MSVHSEERGPQVEFDHLSPEFAADPPGGFRKLREQTPVAYSVCYNGFWVPTRFEDISAVSGDPALFSSRRQDEHPELCTTIVPAIPMASIASPSEYDPPEFKAYRHIANRLLSKSEVESKLMPLARALIDYCIDSIIEEGAGDIVHDIAGPVPALLTMIWLGLPTDEWRRFADLQHNVFACPPGSAGFESAISDLGWQHDMVQEVIASRRARPLEDAISFLVTQVGPTGEPLSDVEITELVTTLSSGGIDTTTSLTSQVLKYLWDHPEAKVALEDPRSSVAERATEEFLRYYSPVTATGRTATRDTELGGCPLRRGDPVMVSWFAANRDPEMFVDPDQVILDRSPNRHAAFGLGIHRCAGSNLARLEFREIVAAVLQRMPDYVVDVAGAEPYPSAGINSGWFTLPVTFTPGPRIRQSRELPSLR